MPPAEAEAAAAPAAWTALTGRFAAVAAAARALPRQPWSVLGPLVLVQWAAVAAFALTVRHNGWLFYQGGDESAYYTTAWSLGHGYLPLTSIGFGWSTLLAPIALIAGKSYLSALPAIVVLQGVVLLPLALVSVYSIAARLGGRILGYWAAGLWIAAPFSLILAADPRYHDRYVEQFLPQLLGLTGLADFPSLVILLAGAALILRALDERGRANVVLAGLVVGFAVGVKPANAIFLIAAGLTFLARRRIGDGILFGLVLIPSIVALAIWKQRGLGHIPLFALGTHSLAAGGGGLILPQPPSLLGTIGATYVRLDWQHINQSLIALREFFWNTRLLEVLPFAGFLAVTRRSRPAAVLLGGWFAAFFVIKGSSQYSTVESGSFFRFLMPALPAYFLLAASLPLLVPTIGRRLAQAGTTLPSRRGLPYPRVTIAAAAIVLAAAPLLLITFAPHLPAHSAINYAPNGTYIPLTSRLTPKVETAPGTVRMTWQPSSSDNAGSFYRVLRSPRGLKKQQDYWIYFTEVGTTRTPAFTDRPAPGRWWYAIGMGANWLDDPTKGDLLLASQAIPIDVP